MAITKVVFSTCSFLFADKKVLNNSDITLVFSTLFSFYLLCITALWSAEYFFWFRLSYTFSFIYGDLSPCSPCADFGWALWWFLLLLVSFLGFDLFLIFNLILLLFPLPINCFYPLSILFSSVLLVKRSSCRRSSA